MPARPQTRTRWLSPDAVRPQSPLKKGDKLPIRLEFEKAGKAQISLDVQGVGAPGPTASPSSGSKKGMKGMSPGMKM
jgi:hypothetical protein